VQSSKISRRLALGLVAVALPALTSCAASIEAQLQEPYTPGNAVWADTDNLRVRGVVAVAPTDGAATLVGTILNEGDVDDALVAIRVPGGQARIGTGTAPRSAPVRLPAGGTAVLGADSALGEATPVAIESRSVRLGSTIPVVFDFERAGSVQLDVLVVPRRGEYATVPPPVGTRRTGA
jgi:hypothetical protein